MVKKIMNRPEQIVEEMMEGFAWANPQIATFPELRVAALKEKFPGKVGVMSVGGSGHEPAHAGYIGKGMLDAAVLGNLFASPSPEQMLKAIEETNTGNGVLVVLKNYSGDRMNYSVAREFAQAKGISVESVVVKDDVAVPDSTYSTGRRGIAGTIFVHKIAGAKAAEGASLEEVKATAEKVAERIRSMGMSFGACVLPGLDKPGFQIEEDQIEVGMGIHGEPGIQTMPMKNAAELAEILVRRILADRSYQGEETAVLINGLGSTPLMELYVLAAEVKKILCGEGISVEKVLVGNYMTSLEMAGCSVTLFGLDEELKRLLLAPCQTPAFCIQEEVKCLH